MRIQAKAALALAILLVGLVAGGGPPQFVQAANLAWTQLSPGGTPPGARESQAAVWDTADNQMLVFGGDFESTSTGCCTISDNGLWSYRPATNSWSVLSTAGPTLTGTQSHPLAVWDPADGLMFVVVDNNVPLNDLWSYRPATNSWTHLNPSGSLPGSVDASSVVWDAADGQMLLFGGSPSCCTVSVNQLWSYSPASNSWTQLNPSGSLPSPRFGQKAVWDAADGQMLVFGGETENNGPQQYFNDLWSYRPAGNSWTQLSPSGLLPGSRAESSAVPSLPT